MVTHKIETVISLPDTPIIKYSNEIEGPTEQNPETVYALLRGHLTTLQTELDSLEIRIKRKKQ